MHTSPSPTWPKKLPAARTGAQSIKAAHVAANQRFAPFAMTVTHPVARIQRHARRNRDVCSGGGCKSCFWALRNVAWGGERALRQLALEGGAPRLRIALRRG